MIRFAETPKQGQFARAVFSGKYKYLFYGGAIRGGKSYAVMAVLFVLCKLYPGSRWAIVRKDLPTLRRNILPVFEKLRPANFGPMKQDTWEAVAENGSRIMLFPESYSGDKNYERWKGLEVNGFWLEEANELEETSWQWSLQRAGAYIIPASLTNPNPRQPLPYIMLTSNPATNWVKRIFYTPWTQGALKAPFFYIPATVKDNPHLPQAYLDSLELLPERDYKVYVLGSWDELAGAALEELNERIHLIPAIKVPDHWMRFGAFDWGYRHPFSFGLYAASSEAIFKVETITGRGLADAAIISYVKEVSESVNFPATELQYTVAGHDAFHDVQARAAIGETTAERFAKSGIPMIRADTSRISGLKNLREMTAWQKTGPKGLPGLPRFRFFDTPSNRACFAQLQNMVLAPDRPEDVLKVDATDEGNGGDDAYDETRYALQSRAQGGPEPVQEVGEDQHPGFDYKLKKRKLRRQVATDPMVLADDDLRPNLYRTPAIAGATPFHMPRWGMDNEGGDDGAL